MTRLGHPGIVRCACGRAADFVDGTAIYPHRPDLAHKRFYQCVPCGAYVGCHPGTARPLGTLADRPTRAARARVHAAFDPLWRTGRWRRQDAYGWLAGELGFPPRAGCHIGTFDLATCQRALVAIDRLPGK